MPFRTLAAVTMLVLGATVAHAQGGVGRDKGPPKEKPHIVTSDSVERLNPISPLIEHRRDIGVPDSLIGKLGGILARLDAANMLLLQQVDSLAANPGGPVTISDDVDRGGADRGGRRPVSLAGLFAQIGRNNDTAAQQALALLSGKTADRARRLIDDQRKKMDQLLQDSRVGRGAGGG
ncbi:MAG: hypothetical protein KGN74_08990 [Gemmatimonadota bacterium]|nr:hypothetical protein [Gemmatimonadota bacterium]